MTARIDRKHCPCCGEFLGDAAFYARLDAMCETLGYVPTVSSGYRCAAHNRAVSRRSTGRHVTGQAVDVIAKGPRIRGALLDAALKAGLVSFAILPGGAGLHIDAGTVPWLGIE